VLSFIAAGFAISQVNFFKERNNRTALVVIVVFIAQLCLVLIVDNRDFAYKFYGTFGRNTGFAAYLSLAFLLLASMVSASKILLQRYILAILACGTFLAIYGCAQFIGLDFSQYEIVYDSKVFGTFGNPNYQSAFMGITAATALTLAVFSKIKKIFKGCLLILTLLAVFNISISSQQGYLNFVAGILTATVMYFLKSRKPIFGWVTLTASSFASVLILLGILNIGPLAQIIYKFSLQARGFYWRAALKMMRDHPFFGVGMDGFGDAYLRFRSSEVASINSGITSDTAHSIPLDIGSNGGVILLIAYLSIISLVLRSIVRISRRSPRFDVVFATVVAAWVAYQAQSLISINQLGMGVWGWSLSGLIIGYDLNYSNQTTNVTDKPAQSRKSKKGKVDALAVVLVFVTTSISIGIALPPYIASDKFYKALQSGNPTLIQTAAYLKPNERMRYLYVAQALQENGFESEAVRVLRDASRIYPDSIDLWRRWAGISSASPTEIAHARAEIKRLDPFNPDLK
jgi:O-antigen ligase